MTNGNANVNVKPTKYVISECTFDVAEAADVDFVIEVAHGFFARGKANEGRALITFFDILTEAVVNYERYMKAIAPFLVEGGQVVMKVNAGDQMPYVRYVARGGKIVREFARVAWGTDAPNAHQNQNNNSNQNQGGKK